MANLKKLLLLSQSLFLIPSVFAAEVPVFSDFITNLGDFLWGWMSNSYSVYFFTFIFFFILLYGIYSAALRFVKIFKGESGLNRQGKLVGISLSLLSCLSIFYFTREKGIDAILEDVLGPFGILAGFGIGITVFGLVYFGFKGEDGSRSWKIALTAAALGMIVTGMITSAPNIMWWGWLLAFIAGIGALISAFSGGRTHRRHSPGPEGPGEGEPGPEGPGEGEPGPEGPGDKTKSTRVYGTVYGEKSGIFKQRKRLANVSINIGDESLTTTTNPKGKYELNIHSGLHQKLTAKLEGYHEYQTYLNLDKNKIKQDIILNPSSTEFPPTQEPAPSGSPSTEVH